LWLYATKYRIGVEGLSANAGGPFVVFGPGISQHTNLMEDSMKHRKHGSMTCKVTTITMSAVDQQHLDAIRERFHDGNINQMPSRSLMLSVLIDWAFKHGFGPKHTEECCG